MFFTSPVSIILLWIIYNTAPPSRKDQLLGGVGSLPESTEHLAEEGQMLTAGLTASICSSLYSSSTQTIERRGWGCFVLKVDLIACNSKKSPFSWRAISLVCDPCLESLWEDRAHKAAVSHSHSCRIVQFIFQYEYHDHANYMSSFTFSDK